MPEPSVTAAPPDPGGPTYRPISGFAVASCAVAVLFALVMVGTMATSWYFDTPLLDLGVITLGVPALSVLLAAAAWWEISSSEGTKEGLGVARNAAVVSAVFGFGYLAYLLGVDIAVRQQAADFTETWFVHLQKGTKADLRTAFWQTLEPAKRKDVNPLADMDMQRFMIPAGRETQGQFPGFLQNELTRIFITAGPDAKPRLLGVKEWGYKSGGYTVQQSYRIESPDGTFEAVVTARGSENPRDFKGRQWQVVWNETGVIKRTFSARGERLMEVQQQARGFAEDWLKVLNRGDLTAAWATTVPALERQRLLPTCEARLLTGSSALIAGLWASSTGGAALAPVMGVLPLADEGLGRAWSLPGYARFLNGGIIRDDEFQSVDAKRSDLVAAFREAIASHLTSDGRLKVRWQPRAVVASRLIPGQPFDVGIEGVAGLVPSNQMTPLYSAEVIIHVECPSGSADGTGSVPFRLVSVSLQRRADQARPGGPPLPPG